MLHASLACFSSPCSPAFLGLVLILIANLAIRGREKDEIYTTEEPVLTNGSISHFTGDQFLDAMVLRSGCQGNRLADPAKNEGNSTVVFYGELRGENSYECITDPALMIAAPIEFGSGLSLINISTGNPGEECRASLRTMDNRTVAEFFCSRATLSCLFDDETNKTDLQSCRGLVYHGNETYICEEGAAWPEMFVEPTRARWVRGVDFRRTEWLDGIFIQPVLLKDTIDATYAASMQRRQVRKARKVHWTCVNPFWLIALGFNVALVAALAFTSLLLKRAGFRPVAHDEQGAGGIAGYRGCSGQLWGAGGGRQSSLMRQREKTGCWSTRTRCRQGHQLLRRYNMTSRAGGGT